MLSIIIPANNEEDYIEACLRALFASRVPKRADSTSIVPVEIIVVANGCSDKTVSIANRFSDEATSTSMKLVVLDITEGNKLNALNVGERNANGTVFVYVDADVIVSPDLIAQLWAVLDRKEPAYASGRPIIAPAKSWVSRAYARAWSRVPFMTEGVQGFGVFAVNSAGRKRWGLFPNIISDDTFVRLQFAPQERIPVSATYQWPIVEGFSKLVRVRRRQDIGVTEIAQKYPKLMQNEDKPRMNLIRLFYLILRNPINFSVYTAVSLAVRLGANSDDQTWNRGR